jgi:hypothetical protein
MNYYLDLFSPQTYEAFLKSSKEITGFRINQLHPANRITIGDKFVCYLTKISRWFGILEVISECFQDETPIFYDTDDPFVVRFKVNPIVLLEKEKAVPIKEDIVWKNLSFTKDLPKQGSHWTGPIRSSLTLMDNNDGKFLEDLLISQVESQNTYEVDPKEYKKFLNPRVRGVEKAVTVSVPEDNDSESGHIRDESEVRESIKIQALLANVGEKMGFRIWIPKNDRSRVLKEWDPDHGSLIDILPLNYDEVTLKTIEQIDVLWLKRRSIVRAFEVEHTTSIYSGILRMADLLALQPNMDIKLHIVSPEERREKVFEEIQRPVFSLLERGALSEYCTFISYDSLRDLSHEKHLNHLTDDVIEDYEEIAE